MALACGAVGGDHREAPVPLVCDPAATPASQPSPEPGSATRNSIDLLTGNKYLHQVDAAWPGGLILDRHYNSLNAFEQGMGPGWRLGFDTVIDLVPAGAGWRAQLIQADGRRIVFESAPGTSGPRALLMLPKLPGHGWIRLQPDMSADRRLTWTWRNGSQLHFDTGGRLTAIDHADGRRLTLTHGGQPVRLREVRNRHGLALHFQYAGQPQRLVGVTLPDGRLVRYTYHPEGPLAAAFAPTDPLPIAPAQARPRWRYDYADEFLAALSTLRDGQGQVLGRWQYGAQGRATHSSLAGGEDAIDVRYHLPASADAIGVTIVTDRLGHQARYGWRYDAPSQSRQWLYARGRACGACPSTGTERRYDGRGRLRHERSATGRTTEWVYDHAGRLAQRRDAGQGERQTWYYRYAGDQPDAPLQAIATESRAPERRRQLDLVYDALGRLVGANESGYEPVLASLVRRQPDGVAVRDWRPISRQRRIERVSGGRASGLPAREIDPRDGRILREFTYDEQGYLTVIRHPMGLEQVFRRDAFGRIVERIEADGHRLTYRFDGTGRLVESTDRGIPTQYQYDAQGRLSRVAAANRPAIEYRYSPAGRLVGLRDQQGHRIAFSWPGADTPVVVAPAAMPSATDRLVAHWQAGVLTLSRPDTNDRTHWLLDDFGRPLANLDPHLGLRLWQYDARDRQVARVDAQGSRHAFVHDAADRLVAITDRSGRALLTQRFQGARLDARAGPTQTEQFQYDAHGRRVGRVLRLRDPAGLHGGPTVSIAEHFDEHGRLQARDLPGGHRLVHRWRADHTLDGLALQVAGGATIPLVTDCHWLPFTGGHRGLRFAHLGNGTSVRVRYDQRLRVVGLLHQPAPHRPAVDLPAMTRSFDAAGRTARLVTTAGPVQFTYDARGFLASAVADSVAGSAGAWRYRADGSPTTASLVQARLRGRDATGVGRSFETLANGARLLRTPSGRPERLFSQRGEAFRYLYNLQGERIAKLRDDAPGQSRWFVHEQGRLGMEFDAHGQLRRLHVSLDDRPLAVVEFTDRSADVRWLHTDHRGLPLAVTDRQGRLVWAGRYSAHGRLLATVHDGAGHGQQTRTPGSLAPHTARLAGQHFDPETGLHENYQRSYDPAAGRYLSPDPLGLRVGGYRHAYANNQPLDQTDPLGLYEIDVHYYLTYFLARSAGIDHDTSRVIALAAQGIDDNADTQPIDIAEDGRMSLVSTSLNNHERLLSYHFVLTEPVRSPAPPSLSFRTPTSTDVRHPTSAQLDRLMAAVSAVADPCAQAHLLGEYVHAFQDTFSHRNADNEPYAPFWHVPLQLGMGHALDMHDPDWTFNHTNRPPEVFEFSEQYTDGTTGTPGTPDGLTRIRYEDWSVNEARTLQMERELHALLTQYGDSSRAVPFSEIEAMLTRFNATPEWQREGATDGESFPQKLRTLADELSRLGFSVEGEPIQFTGGANDANSSYSETEAIQNRFRALCPSPALQGVLTPRCNR